MNICPSLSNFICGSPILAAPHRDRVKWVGHIHVFLRFPHADHLRTMKRMLPEFMEKQSD